MPTTEPTAGPTAPLDRPLHGRCLCGGVTVELTGAVPQVDICHCTMCQRWGGGFFGGIGGADFTLAGADRVTVYRSSDWAERAFCTICGSHLWFRFVPADRHSFMIGLFSLPEDMAARVTIEQQIFVDEKPFWFDIAQSSPMKTGAETLAEARAAGFAIG